MNRGLFLVIASILVFTGIIALASEGVREDERFELARWDREERERWDREGREWDRSDRRHSRELMECSGLMSRLRRYDDLFSSRMEDRLDRLEQRYAEASDRSEYPAGERERERWFERGGQRADAIVEQSSQGSLVIEEILRENVWTEVRRCNELLRR